MGAPAWVASAVAPAPSQFLTIESTRGVVVEGVRVLAAQDQSDQRNDLELFGVGNTAPTLVAAQFGPDPILRMTGGTALKRLTSACPAGTTRTIFMLAKFTPTTTAEFVSLFGAKISLRQVSTGGTVESIAYTGATPTSRSSGSDAHDGAYFLIEHFWDGVNHRCRFNGGTGLPIACADTLPTSGAIYLGKRSDGSFPATIDLHTLKCTYGALPTAAARRAIEAEYQALSQTKRGVQLWVPADEYVIFCLGNSLTYGDQSSDPGGTTAYPARLAVALGIASTRVVNYGVSARTIAELLNSPSTQAVVEDNFSAQRTGAIVAGGNILFVDEWVNSLGTLTIDQCMTQMITKVTVLKDAGWTVVMGTMLKNTRATDVSRPALNARINAGETGAHYVCDWATDAAFQDANDATYYVDGTHLTDAGYNAKALFAKARLQALGLVP